MNTNLDGEYCSQAEATHLRIFYDFEGWAIDAATDDGRYTEKIWTHYDGELLTREKAIEVACEFAASICRPELANRVKVSRERLAKHTLLSRLAAWLKSWLK